MVVQMPEARRPSLHAQALSRQSPHHPRRGGGDPAEFTKNFNFATPLILTSRPFGNTVIPMTTLTFKVAEDEAQNLRVAARRARLSLSEYLRRQIRMNTVEAKPVGRIKCRHTGARIFAPVPQHPLLTTESVKEILADFP
jgi:hypothetical protein